MVTDTTTSATMTTQLEDPLSYLPCSTISEYRKGQVLFEPGQRSPYLHLVMEGCIKISRIIDNNEIVIDLCQADDFFGEPAFLGLDTAERAVALDGSKIMSWPIQTVQELICRHPQLGIALVQLLARRGMDLSERMGTLSVDCTSRRLAKALLHLAERMGQPDAQSPQVVQTAPFAHKLLAQYIGTTREAVTHCMNQFRRQGFLTYSRRGMTIYRDNIVGWLESTAKSNPGPSATGPRQQRQQPEIHSDHLENENDTLSV
ncbi:MAG: Crp/Fnr family transcriptional regulator [Bryobacteraceae bacterium]|nr:Crp/Fnr family transcriptional regulator [Bryobacteraceae bacterium]